MRDMLAENPLELAVSEQQLRVVYSARTVRTQRSAYAFIRGHYDKVAQVRARLALDAPVSTDESRSHVLRG